MSWRREQRRSALPLAFCITAWDGLGSRVAPHRAHSAFAESHSAYPRRLGPTAAARPQQDLPDEAVEQ